MLEQSRHNRKESLLLMPRKKKLTKRIYPEILNMSELRSFLRVSYGTAMELIVTGQIPAIQIGREWRIPKQDVIHWVQKGGPNERNNGIRIADRPT
jgi:excisionase family DNA binding protein